MLHFTPFIQKRCTNFYVVRNIYCIIYRISFSSFIFVLWLEIIFPFRFGTVVRLCLCSCYSWHFFSHGLRECSHISTPLHFSAKSESSEKRNKDRSLFYSVESLIIYFSFLFGLTTGKKFNKYAFCWKIFRNF